ncbi:hypothetical protein JCM5350_001425 [Sporobolomyces pararoseus]
MYSYLGASWLIIRLLKPRLERIFNSESTTLEISRIFIHLSTTSFNSFPSTVLEWIPQRTRQGDRKGESDRRLNEYWDLATLIVVGCFVLSQGVLVWALYKALFALYHLTFPADPVSLESALLKRAPIPITYPSSDSPSSELLIQPLIPGLTTSLDALPTLILALAISQIYHEWGHALCAASESLSLSSTGFYLFFLLLPTFYVSITPTSLTTQNPWRELRVATAGVWNNLQLVLVGWIGMNRKVGGLGLFESDVENGKTSLSEKLGMVRTVEKGVKVIRVTKNSPLESLIPSRLTTITHLNDLELDSSSSGPLALFNRYLSSTAQAQDSVFRSEEEEGGGYDNLGWCLSKEMFEKPVRDLECCQQEEEEGGGGGGGGTTYNSTRESNSRELCFKETFSMNRFNDSTRLAACLDPIPFLRPAISQGEEASIPSTSVEKEKVQRCLNEKSCQGERDTSVCAKLDPFRVVRIGIEIVEVSDVEPVYWFIPFGIDESSSRFFSALFSLSLTLGFFNLLPLPFLDGSHVLSSFLKCVSSSHNYSLYFGRGGDSLPLSSSNRATHHHSAPDSGWLHATIESLVKRTKIGEIVANERKRLKIETFLKRWTTGVGGCLALITIVVQILG